MEAIAAAIQKLGVQLLQNLEATPEQPNIIISPFSISLALSQLALGMHVLLQLLHDTSYLISLFSCTRVMTCVSKHVYSCLETVTVPIQSSQPSSSQVR